MDIRKVDLMGNRQQRWGGAWLARLAMVVALTATVVVAVPATAGAQTRQCNGLMPTIVAIVGVPTVGTSGDDVILGTRGRDVINGGGGDDTICSLGGADVVNAGTGDDVVLAGGGADLVRGGRVSDLILGQGGRDDLRGQGGADVIAGGGGMDEISGGGGGDVVAGNGGDDVINGNGGADALGGNKGNDTINGGGGPDYLEGNGGADTLLGGRGVDECVGGPGVDRLGSCELPSAPGPDPDPEPTPDPDPVPDPCAPRGEVGQTRTVTSSFDPAIEVTLLCFADPAPPASSFDEPAAGRRLVAAHFRVTNLGTSNWFSCASIDAELRDTQGATFTAGFNDTSLGQSFGCPTALPGETVSGWVTYEVTDGRTIDFIRWESCCLGDPGTLADWTV